MEKSAVIDRAEVRGRLERMNTRLDSLELKLTSSGDDNRVQFQALLDQIKSAQGEAAANHKATQSILQTLAKEFAEVRKAMNSSQPKVPKAQMNMMICLGEN